MELAYRMASRAVGTTASNPPVGCIIVKNNKIISRGWTQPLGRPHAEIHALNGVKDKSLLKGAELFCTLEPCSHFGKTNPCVDSIINAGIRTVYIGDIDKNPLVNGKGIEKLKLNKVKVLLNKEHKGVSDLNKIFFNSKINNKPNITIKIASTLDSKIATLSSKSKWITNELSRSHGHYLRFKSDALLVGKNTIIIDNPDLHCRLAGLSPFSPDIFILDSNLEIPLNKKIFKPTKRNVYIFYNKNIEKNKLKKYNKNKIILIPVNYINKFLDLNDVAIKMCELGAQRVLVEGGAELITQLIDKKLVDKLYWFRASKIIGKEGLNAVSNLNISKMSSIKELSLVSNMQIQSDTLEIYKRK